MQNQEFPLCDNPIGFYPIVDSVEWVGKLIDWGVKTLQLRIKMGAAQDIETAVKQASEIANANCIQLFINDYWELAIEYGAYGVHLGQEDLVTCDINSLMTARLRLGISTHSDAELARALQIDPSYIALGPIYHTTAKKMPFAPQGMDTLAKWRQVVKKQLVAIGGINLSNIEPVLQCGVDGVSVISAITQAKNPQLACQQFLAYFKHA